MNRKRLIAGLVLVSTICLCVGCGGSGSGLRDAGPEEGSKEPRFVRKISWIGSGQWIKTDTHIHSKFSDGGHTILELTSKALSFGCQAIAITDHASVGLDAATPGYQVAILQARHEHPNLVILAGLEWNIPPWGGDEHATVLVPQGDNEWDTLLGFKTRFDDYRRPTHVATLADEALRWLDQQSTVHDQKPLVIVNHPSRKREDSLSLIDDIVHWRELNDLVVGFSGAPGHQRAVPLGAYKNEIQLIDRWDPAAARIGDSWDQLLQRGIDLWGARAPSDVHRASAKKASDYWPGQFSETWLYASSQSPDAVMDALRQGSFFAGHGHIAREVELTVQAEGLPRPAHVGEVIEVEVGTEVEISLQFLVPDTDWQGQPNQIDEIELVGIDSSGAKSLHTQLVKGPTVSVVFKHLVPEGGLTVRARGRRLMEGDDLLFYTNSIRVLARQ